MGFYLFIGFISNTHIWGALLQEREIVVQQKEMNKDKSVDKTET